MQVLVVVVAYNVVMTIDSAISYTYPNTVDC